MQKLTTLMITLVFCCFFNLAAKADIAAQIVRDRFDNGGWPISNSVHGWEFSPTVDIVVTHLGLYDESEMLYSEPGFRDRHPIGIFSSDTELLLVEEEILPGTDLPLIDGFRYLAIAPLLLEANFNYVIAYHSPFVANPATSDMVWTYFQEPPSFSSDIQHVSTRYEGDYLDLGFPHHLDELGQQYRFGPNFQYTVVPEPSAYALIALGVLLMRTRKIQSSSGLNA